MLHPSLLLPSLNSTIVRISSDAEHRLLRTYLGVAARLSPGLAHRQGERLFRTPPPSRRAKVDIAAPAPARRETVASPVGDLALWQTGPADAPAVLLIHGWGGTGAQLGAFVAPLLALGYRVVWFDHPGHGASGQRRVGLPDFVAAIEAISTACGPFAAAVGHSLGASAAVLALRRGWPLQRVALLSAPTSIREQLHGFARLFGLPPAIHDGIRRRIEARYAVRLDDIDRLDALADVGLPALVVHDRNDRRVPFAHAERLVRHLPRAQLIATHGLGHFHLIRAADVVHTVADFLAGRQSAVPPELPVLPHPAPLY